MNSRMHQLRKLLAVVAFALSVCSSHAFEPAVERADWKQHFDRAKAIGTIIVVDERTPSKGTFVYNADRANVRYSPASTFKVAHTLFALHAGAVHDEFQTFKWDGVPRAYSGHNEDQNLRSAMRSSTLWVYSALPSKSGNARPKDT